jgi:hypothetical protein
MKTIYGSLSSSLLINNLSTTSARIVGFPSALLTMTMNMGGSATQALERSLKRQRIIPSNPQFTSTTAALEAAFNLDQVFSSLYSPDEESFPSLSWNFDDEPETKPDAVRNSPPTGLSSLKRDRECGVSGLGIVRSKALKHGLNTLACINSSAPTKPLSEKIAPDFIADVLKLSSASIDDLSKTSSSKLSLNQMTRLSRFGPSLLMNDDIANRARGLFPLTF